MVKFVIKFQRVIEKYHKFRRGHPQSCSCFTRKEIILMAFGQPILLKIVDNFGNVFFNKIENSPSVLLHSVKYFLNDVALVDLSNLASSFLPKSELMTIVFSPGEINQFNYGKCTAIIRVMDFVECIASVGFDNDQVKVNKCLIGKCIKIEIPNLIFQ